jgi:hypothetical protein
MRRGKRTWCESFVAAEMAASTAAVSRSFSSSSLSSLAEASSFAATPEPAAPTCVPFCARIKGKRLLRDDGPASSPPPSGAALRLVFRVPPFGHSTVSTWASSQGWLVARAKNAAAITWKKDHIKAAAKRVNP